MDRKYGPNVIVTLVFILLKSIHCIKELLQFYVMYMLTWGKYDIGNNEKN